VSADERHRPQVSRLPHLIEMLPRFWVGYIIFLILNANNVMYSPIYNRRCETTSQHSCKFISWTNEIQKGTSMLLPSITLLQHHATYSNRHSQIKRKVHKENSNEPKPSWTICWLRLQVKSVGADVGGELNAAHPVGLLLLARFHAVDVEVRLLVV
jgi:hypothetical protein